jgi:tetratricopeptide (TPR) repeat protein
MGEPLLSALPGVLIGSTTPTGNIDLAISAANRLDGLVGDPTQSALAMQHWGLIRLSESRDADAIEAFECAMKLAPQGSLRIAAAVNLATCIVHQGHLSRAIEVYFQSNRPASLIPFVALRLQKTSSGKIL